VSSSLKRLLRYEERAEPAQGQSEGSLLAGIPLDAPMDDVVLAAWNGSRFVAYDKWLAAAPLVTEETPPPAAPPNFPSSMDCVAGVCGGTRVWLVKDGERWLMLVGSRKASGRRRDFASPFIGHAIRTAEHWYGPAADGWRAEGGGAEK
jgi:hypothetical protein